jgi:hypothetical protein
VAEILVADAYLLRVPSADLGKIALLGHSFGGTLSLAASAIPLPFLPRATIDISGGALDWADNVHYHDALKDWVKLRLMPIFLLQPNNEAGPGGSVEPTIELSWTAGHSGNRQFQAALYPDVLPDPGECPGHDTCDGSRLIVSEAHGRFLINVGAWGPAALDFLKRYGVTP